MKSLLVICISFALTNIAFAQSPGSEWLSYNNGLQSQRFSPLKQITTDNAAQLGEVCRVQIDGPTSFHAGLLMKDGVLYGNTAFETVAVNATTCELIWKFAYQPEDERCGGSNRGMALLNGRLFRGMCDGRLVALDTATGKLIWKNQIAVPALGESTTAAPLAWQNIVFMGIGGSELGVRGRILAFDAGSGRELWRFHTIPMGDDVGAKTWKRPESAKTGGGGVWGVMSLDVTRGELFVPVGNPWPDIDVGYRPGDNLFTNTVVVLDAFTGKLKWWHQVTPSDWEDFDLVAAPVLYRVDGAKDIVAIGGKDGYITAVDRDSHEVIFKTPVTTVEHIHKKPSRQGTRMCPGYAGGVEWNGPALDIPNNQLIVGAVDICFIVTLGDTVYKAAEVSFGGTVAPDGLATGWVTALDSSTGEVRWKYHAEKPVIAAVTPTAGGVTFTGDVAGNFYVFNSKNGVVVYKKDVGGAMAGGVITYEINDKQFVAFNAGNISRNAFGDVGLPSIVVMTLNPDQPAATLDATNAAVGGIANGRRLYGQVCSSCHGTDGNLIADHKLGNLKQRLDLHATIAYIKNPKAPMPKMFPDLLGEQSVMDVAKFVHEEL